MGRSDHAVHTNAGGTLRHSAQHIDRERAWWAIGITTAYGVLDEIHQSFVPGRDANVLDVLADFTGAALAVLIVPKLYRRWFG